MVPAAIKAIAYGRRQKIFGFRYFLMVALLHQCELNAMYQTTLLTVQGKSFGSVYCRV